MFEYGEHKSDVSLVTFQHTFGVVDTFMAIDTIAHIC